MTSTAASGEILPADRVILPVDGENTTAMLGAFDLTALLPLWSTTSVNGASSGGGGEVLRPAAIPEYARTIGLIEAMFPDDCVFHPTPENYVMIVAFCIIFCLSVVGNSVVVVVILQQRSMRSVTNLYLLNLALSDLLLSVVCMPPTLVSSLVYCWVFGDLLCKLLAYLQPVVVTASAYTLAAIALERYYAIVRPLHSRVWHTKSHALLVIALVWLISIIANLFMLFMYELRTYNRNGLNCAPKYDAIVHFAYQIYMTVALLIVPLVIMTGLYGAVIRTLRYGIKMDIAAVDASNYESNDLLNKMGSVAQPTPQSVNQHDPLSKQASNRSKLNYGSYMGRRSDAAPPRVPPRQLNAETAPFENGAVLPQLTFDANNNKFSNNNSNRAGKLRTANLKSLTRASWSSVMSMRCRQPNTSNFSFLPRGKKISAARTLPAAVTSPYSGRSSFDDGRATSAGAACELGARSVRSTHSGRTAVVKQRLIRMLIVIVIIFFCCWTPSYIWWLLLNAQDSFGTFNVWNSELNTFITVLTYLSSCTNPITYCFLNSKFRNALFLSFGCKWLSRRAAVCAHVQRVYGGGGGGAPQSPPAVQNNAATRAARSFRYAPPHGTLQSAPSADREFSSNLSNENYGSEPTTGEFGDPSVAPSPAFPPQMFNGRAASTRSAQPAATAELDASLLAHDGVNRVRPHSLGRFDFLGRMRDAFARHHPPHLPHSNTRSGHSSPVDDAPPSRRGSVEERAASTILSASLVVVPPYCPSCHNDCSSTTSLASSGPVQPTVDNPAADILPQQF